MSNGGGGESSRVNQSTSKKKTKNDEFPQSLARIAVAQICANVGLHGFQQSALDTLSDITCKYIQELGKTSNFYANLAGRSESNISDIVNGLEDLGLSQGFTGASDMNHCLSQSGIIKEISQYIDVSSELGFAYTIPPFPVIKERQLTPTFFQTGITPQLDHIPDWLPCFPDRVDQDEKVKDPPLLKSEQQLVCNGSSSQVPVNNPFFSIPLEYGKKEVSLISLPVRFVEEDVAKNHSLWAKHVSELGTFGPVIHGLKSRDVDDEEERKKIGFERSCSVKLKFQIRKKCLGNLELGCLFRDDELRNEKKRRKEKIVTELLENGTCNQNDVDVN